VLFVYIMTTSNLC